MFDTNYEIIPGGAQLKFTKTEKKLFGLSKSVTSSDLRGWSRESGASAALAHAQLATMADQDPDAIWEADGYLRLSNAAIARLSSNTLAALGLPPRTDLTLSLRQNGSLASDKFVVEPVWLQRGRPVHIERKGVFLEPNTDPSIVPDPIYSALEAIEAYKDDGDIGSRMAHMSDVLRLVRRELETDDGLSYEDYAQLEGALSQCKIKVAKSIGISIQLKHDGYHSTPVLFGEDANNLRDRVKDNDGRSAASEKDGLLDARERIAFEHGPKDGFRTANKAKRSYLLGSGEYVLIDEDLMPALEHIREIADAPAEEREEFARNPLGAITSIYRKQLEKRGGDGLENDLEEEQLERLIEAVFVETEEFSDRVIGLGLWEPPVLPFIKRKPNSWEPEEFGVMIGENFIPLAPDDVEELRGKMGKAQEQGRNTVEYKGQQIAVNENTIRTIGMLVGIVKPVGTGSGGNGRNSPPKREVLLIKHNFKEAEFRVDQRLRDKYIEKSVPETISSKLMPHQKDSLDWQIDAYLQGLPGILNADDQGLGKTLQTLTFMAWLQENMKAGPDERKKPILVVAPTSLLKNWTSEVETHMKSRFALGAPIEAYGSGLRTIRKENSAGKKTIDLGVGPEVDPNSRLIWVLTTYQTLSENQIDFAKIDFATVIFDEIQAVKNVTTFTHHACQSLNADFQIGLTGTPVENAISDLWAIVDTLAPGFFGTLKDFVRRYGSATEEKYRELNRSLFEDGYFGSEDGGPAPRLAIRRMKTDALANLPLKKYRYYPEMMPSQQAIAYDQVFLRLSEMAQGRALKMLHQLRTVSLYPDRLELLRESENPYEDLVTKSARMKATFDILDEAKSLGEKVLVFLENVELQLILRGVLEQRYKLPEVPILNGSVLPQRRGAIVQSFQEAKGDGEFAIMLLGPKAAGVGLTLTAATHVIHLSRWWNPAIEEQCNDRIYRIGQKLDCTVHIPMSVHSKHMENTFDCILNDIMLRKRKLFQEVLMPLEDVTREPSDMIARINGDNKFDITEIDRMSWEDFENWALNEAKKTGLWKVSKTPRTGDKGADGYMEHVIRGDIVLVQCKHTGDLSKVLGPAAVAQVAGSREFYPSRGRKRVIVLTNANGFTKEAMQKADEDDVILVDRHRLALWPKHLV